MHFKQDEKWAAFDVAQVREFKFSIRPTIDILDMQWDIYWSMGEDEPEKRPVLEAVNDSLTRAAIAALETGERRTFYHVAESFGAFGSSDSEPIRQFEWLWRMVYGEDE
jgi:hypothetical protein